MIKLAQLIEESLENGEMSQATHDAIMKEIHRDGQIDQEESKLLSRLFQATRTGELRIVESERDALATNHRLQARKEEAFQREQVRQQARGAAPQPTTPSVAKNEASLELNEQPSDEVEEAALEPAAFPEGVNSANFDSLFGSVCEERTDGPVFKAYSERLLDVRLNGTVWLKTGAMVGYYGNIKFTREGIFEHGLKKLMKKGATGEGAQLTKAVGQGNLYLADQGKKISVIDLRGQAMVVNGPNILAFEESVHWDIAFLKQLAAAAAGGWFNVRLHGAGMAAITTHFDPIVLRVTPKRPVMTDMAATVAWSGGLAPQIKTDISMQTFIGRASGETIQMAFHGDGHVIIQPYEEMPLVNKETN